MIIPTSLIMMVATILQTAAVQVRLMARDNVVVGFVANGVLYHLAREPRVAIDLPWSRPAILSSLDLRRPAKASEVTKYRFLNVWERDGHPLSWHVAHGCLWISCRSAARVPLDELALFDVRPNDRAKALLKERYPGWGGVDVGSSHHWPVLPWFKIEEDYSEDERYRLSGDPGRIPAWGRVGMKPEKDTFNTYGDILPTSKDKARLFVLSPDKHYGAFDIWEGERILPKGEKWWTVKWTEKPVERFKSYFVEPFTLYTKGSTYLFVTPSGRYYLSLEPDPQQAEFAPNYGKRHAHMHWIGSTGKTYLWEPKAPWLAEAVIVDVDADETYVFVRPPSVKDDNVERGYFPLSGRTRVKTYTRAEFGPVTLDEPLKTVVQYAQFLIDKGEMKVK